MGSPNPISDAQGSCLFWAAGGWSNFSKEGERIENEHRWAILGQWEMKC